MKLQRDNIVKFFKTKYSIIIPFLILVSLSLINIGSEEYWPDEYYHLLIAYNLPLNEIINYVKLMHHPPFFYLLMKPYLTVFGINEIFGRLPSLFFAVLSLFIYHKLLTTYIKKTFYLFLATLAFPLSSLNIEYSQEAGLYTLFLFEYFLVIYLITYILKRGSASSLVLILITVINTIGLYTHYSYSVYFLSLFLSLLIFVRFHPVYRKIIKALGVSFFISLLLFTPWIMNIYKYSFESGAYTYISSEYKNILYFLSGIFYFKHLQVNFFLHALSFILFAIFLITIVYKIKEIIDMKRNLLLFFILNAFVTLIIFYLSPLSIMYSYTWQRHMIILHNLFLVALFLFSFSLLKKRVLVIFILSFLFLSLTNTLPLVVSNDSLWFYNHQYKKIIKFISENENKNDLILIPRITFDLLIRRYYPGNNKITTIINDEPNSFGLPDKTATQIAFDPNRITRESTYLNGLAAISSTYKRIWLVNNYREEDKYALEFFRNSTGWTFKTIPDFPNERLWLIEKRS